MKFYPKAKIKLILIIPILMLCVLGCTGDDDNNNQVASIPEYLEGDYVGTWNSVTPSTSFTDYAFSASLQIVSDNILSGSWYAVDTFEVCCSEGDDDGTMTMMINGNDITSFVLDDVIIDCSGVFTGTGAIRESDNALIIDFTGADCDGEHVGQLVMIKQ